MCGQPTADDIAQAIREAEIQAVDRILRQRESAIRILRRCVHQLESANTSTSCFVYGGGIADAMKRLEEDIACDGQKEPSDE